MKDASEHVRPTVRRAVAKHADEAEAVEASLRELGQKLEELNEKVTLPKFVRNRDSGVLHRANGIIGWESFRGDPMFTPCGWRYHSGNSELFKEVPTGCKYSNICSRCLPEARLTARQAVNDDSSSES